MLNKILLATTAVCVVGWWASSVGILALRHYMETKQYTPPTSNEVEACVRWAVKRKLLRKP